MGRFHFFCVGVFAWCVTRLWGHLLIPVLLGSALWAIFGEWVGWSVVHWLAWVGSMVVIGWLLTLAAWIRFYWELYTSESQ